MGEKNSKRRLTLMLVGVFIFLVALIVGSFLIRNQMSKSLYSESIKSAEKYLESNDYELAVLEYQKAIELCPENESGYIGLAEVYLKNGKSSSAKILLKRGLAHTGSSRIQYMINGIEDGSLLADAGETEMKKETMQEFGILAWNMSFLQKLEHYNFTDYCEQFGGFPQIAKTGRGKLEVVHKDLPGTCYYANTEKQDDIVDEKTGKPAKDGMPEKTSVDSLNHIFQNFHGIIGLAELNSLSSSKVEPITKDGRTYVELSIASLSIRIETNKSGTIVSDTAWNEIILKNANKDRSKAGILTGVVVDASSREGIAGAKLDFKAESDSKNNGSVLTARDGSFSIELRQGVYTVTITADGYVQESFKFEMEEDKNYSGEQFVISPELAAGSARIVLEWNAQPQDLDSYLVGESDGGKHVYVNYQYRVSSDTNGTIAELDVDDTNGYGPETITLNDLNGVYTYRVVDFRVTGTLQQHGATVKIYLPGQGAPTIITLDPNAGVKNVWEVFEINHGEVKILNRAPAQENLRGANK